MDTSKNKSTYTAYNKDGFVCSYDSVTHKCVGVILSTGDNIELLKQNYDTYIGQLDPKYEK